MSVTDLKKQNNKYIRKQLRYEMRMFRRRIRGKNMAGYTLIYSFFEEDWKVRTYINMNNIYHVIKHHAKVFYKTARERMQEFRSQGIIG